MHWYHCDNATFSVFVLLPRPLAPTICTIHLPFPTIILGPPAFDLGIQFDERIHSLSSVRCLLLEIKLQEKSTT